MAISRQEAARKRITRGAILHLLYVSQSAPMMVSTIELSMLPENPQIGSELVPQINYLADRGYIRIVAVGDASSVNPMRGTLVRITDRGQDVIEGTKQDDGIILPDDR